MGLPHYTRVIKGKSIAQGPEYGDRTRLGKGSGVEGDETEDLYLLLQDVLVCALSLPHLTASKSFSIPGKLVWIHICTSSPDVSGQAPRHHRHLDRRNPVDLSAPPNRTRSRPTGTRIARIPLAGRAAPITGADEGMWHGSHIGQGRWRWARGGFGRQESVECAADFTKAGELASTSQPSRPGSLVDAATATEVRCGSVS